jgi:hypothetical protein
MTKTFGHTLFITKPFSIVIPGREPSERAGNP